MGVLGTEEQHPSPSIQVEERVTAAGAREQALALLT